MYSAAEHLRRAAQHLLDNGWIQGAGYIQGRGSCLLGAIEVTAKDCQVDDIDRTVAVVREELYLQGWPYSVAAWNDRPGRTRDEAVGLLQSLALRAAIHEARNG